MKKETKGNLMLLITAIIWGSAFVAQSDGMNYTGAFTYNACRNVIGSLVLIPVIFALRLTNKDFQLKTKEEKKNVNKITLIGGIICGILLFIAGSFQQFGICHTTAGKAGFLTALYIIIVPILGIFVKKKVPVRIWICVIVAMVGFYLLSIKSDFSISKGDILCVICAFCFSVHIMFIDYFGEKDTDGVMMSSVQFMVAGILSFIFAFIFETPQMSDILDAKISILYAGLLSSGIGYTLQIVGQRYTKPTIATLIMSLESVFAALSGWLILHQTLSPKELCGCVLVFAAVLFAQL